MPGNGSEEGRFFGGTLIGLGLLMIVIGAHAWGAFVLLAGLAAFGWSQRPG